MPSPLGEGGASSLKGLGRYWDDCKKWCLNWLKPLEGEEEDEPHRMLKILTADYPKHEDQWFVNNAVSTSKYTVITFLPRALFEQFRRLANVYFLVICILMLIGTYTSYFDSPLSAFSTLMPLIVVLLITMGKEGFEDLKRHKADRETNRRTTEVLSLTDAGEVERIHWKDIQVGRIIRVHDREEIPADVILLTSSEHGGICYIETANIDGETNLKIKQAAPTMADGSGPLWSTPAELHNWEASVDCEAPNSRIHFFSGVIHHDGEGQDRDTPVNQTNLLLRGSTLRNTRWILGLVVYTGTDTKIVMNSRAAPSKLSAIEHTTNRLLYLILGTQVVLVTAVLIMYLVWTSAYESELDYLCYDYNESTRVDDFYRDSCESSSTYSNLGMWFTFLILFNNFVPISLYVTVEMVNYIQAFFIDQDREMYHDDSDTPAMARTSNMNADLAMVKYVFSDKTGTLTQNVMKFKRCSVAGDVFGEGEVPSEMEKDQVLVEGLPLSELDERSRGLDSPYSQFLEILSVCHTVVVETREDTGEKEYQSESPDEEALVSAARDLSWEFTGRTPVEAMVMAHGQERVYRILAVVPFTSDRKRMSVIVRTPEDKLVVMVKGADNVIFSRASSYQDVAPEELDMHLEVFAADGLRTLVLARKELTEEEFSSWYRKFETASKALEDREGKIGEVSEEIESRLTVVGVTAIEDKLQDGVPDTIHNLLQAGVKVWILTGDKMETAINIGYSCRLLHSGMVLIKLQDKGPEGDGDHVKDQLIKLVNHFGRLVEDEALFGGFWSRAKQVVTRQKPKPEPTDWEATTLPTPLLEPQADAPSLDELQSDHLALIVDGPALAHIFGDGDMERLLLKIVTLCKSVVACRVSPAQKRLIVRLIKKGIRPTPMTLSIGDGANDVAMIQEAQIGVGISGKEGRQAVNSSDFAIAQFRYLERLMLLHGRWNYRRISKVILYSFYKNIVLTMILFYYSFYSGFSGQSLFEDYVYTGYNFFLAMPIICVGIFDRDLSPPTLSRFRWVYMSGRENMDLNIKVMAQWLFQAIGDSLTLYFLCYGAFSDPKGAWGEGGDGLYLFGLTVYSCMLMAMIVKAAIYTYTWTWVNWFFFIGSILLYLIFLFIYGSVSSLSEDFYWVPYHMFKRGVFWLLLILVPAVSLVIDYTVIYCKLIFFPTPVDIATEYDRGFYEGGPQADHENVLNWWYPGKLLIGKDLLKRLNETATQMDKDLMGIKTTVESSFDFSAKSVEYGPGAGAKVKWESGMSSPFIHSRASSQSATLEGVTTLAHAIAQAQREEEQKVTTTTSTTRTTTTTTTTTTATMIEFQPPIPPPSTPDDDSTLEGKEIV